MTERKGKRQGDVMFLDADSIPAGAKKLNHLIVAEGEVTGHKHAVTEGEAELYEDEGGTLWLRGGEGGAVVTHPEHDPVVIGEDEIKEIPIQREYNPQANRRVLD